MSSHLCVHLLDNEKMGKMKKLLEILTTPGQRIPLEALLKCEVVLEKMNIKGDVSFSDFKTPFFTTIGSNNVSFSSYKIATRYST